MTQKQADKYGCLSTLCTTGHVCEWKGGSLMVFLLWWVTITTKPSSERGLGLECFTESILPSEDQWPLPQKDTWAVEWLVVCKNNYKWVVVLKVGREKWNKGIGHKGIKEKYITLKHSIFFSVDHIKTQLSFLNTSNTCAFTILITEPSHFTMTSLL